MNIKVKVKPKVPPVKKEDALEKKPEIPKPPAVKRKSILNKVANIIKDDIMSFLHMDEKSRANKIRYEEFLKTLEKENDVK